MGGFSQFAVSLKYWIVRTECKEDLQMKSIGLVALFVLVNIASLAQTQTSDLIPLESIQLTSPETLNKFVQVLPEVKQHFWKLDPVLATLYTALAAACMSCLTMAGNLHGLSLTTA